MARENHLEWDYLLLADADMELKVHRHGLDQRCERAAMTCGKQQDQWATTIADWFSRRLQAGMLESPMNILMSRRLVYLMAQSLSTMPMGPIGQKSTNVILIFSKKHSRPRRGQG